LRRSAALPLTDWSFRARRRSATCVSAIASRAFISSSCRRTRISPATTRSFGLTMTSPTGPTAAADRRISPDQGSTRPGATATQRLSSGWMARRASPGDDGGARKKR
jgi:hypothetical protein